MGDDAGDSDNGQKSWIDTDKAINSYFVVYLSILSFALVMSKFLHDNSKLAAILPEAGMVIIIGIISSCLIYLIIPLPDASGNEDDDSWINNTTSQFVAEELLSFNPQVFFFVLLPPIIFNSGYCLKRELFFRHLKSISLYAIFGTVISTFVIATFLELMKLMNLTGGFQPSFSELLTFGALISATDPVSTLAVFQAKKVDPQLFYLVFGESVLNDAVGLVLFQFSSKLVGNDENMNFFYVLSRFCIDFVFIFFGSAVVGFFTGITSAFFLKKIDMRTAPLLETCLFFLIMYVPFFLAELLGLSGISTILFTGISSRRYATKNLSDATENNVNALFRVTAHLAETTIFLELGLSLFGLSNLNYFHWIFIIWALLACLIGRAMNIYPLTCLVNHSLRNRLENKRMKPSTEMKVASLNSGISCEGILENEIAKDETSELEDHNVLSCSSIDQKIRSSTSHMLCFSGLRGAVAYSCAKNFPDGNRIDFVCTTMVIILVTVFFLGCSTESALIRLGIDMNVNEDQYMNDNHTEEKMIFMTNFENRYINPYIIRDFNHVSNSLDVGILLTELSNTSEERSESLTQAELSKSGHSKDVYASNQNMESRRKTQSVYDYGGR